MTMMSRYDVSSDVILISCYSMLIPGLLLPFVFYITHRDVRSVFHESLKSLYRKMKGGTPHFERRGMTCVLS